MNAKGGKAQERVAAPEHGVDGQAVLQDCSSGIYFAGLGTWTSSPDKALLFGGERDAEEFAQAHRLQNVRVIRRV